MGIGFWQMCLLAGIVLILFGGGKIPQLMKDVARGIKAFKEGLQEEEKPSLKEKLPVKDD